MAPAGGCHIDFDQVTVCSFWKGMLFDPKSPAFLLKLGIILESPLTPNTAEKTEN